MLDDEMIEPPEDIKSPTTQGENEAPMLTDDETSPVNPYPWLRPMPLMWLCVIICIVLIVVGSLMNRAAAEARRKPVIDSFSKVLDGFDISPQQRAILLQKYEDLLESSGTDDAMSKRVERLFVQIDRAMTCLAMESIKAVYQKAFDNELVSASLRSQFVRQFDRLILGVDLGLVSAEICVPLVAVHVKRWNDLNDEKMRKFVDECAKLANNAKVPEEVEQFDMYRSVLRGFADPLLN